MNIDLQKMLKIKTINEWRLFFIIATPISLIIFVAMMEVDLSDGEDVSHMIAYSVRWAVPFIYLVVAASSFHVLFPGPFSKWWLRNRKYIGLCFAVAMAWQGLFIFIVSTFIRDYYFEEIYFFRDEIEGSVGYIFLAAMVLTSFSFGRKYLNAAQWKLIQKGGVYFLWAYPFSVYWWNLYYYPTLEPFADPRLIDYIFYWAGFLAFALRIMAWGKQRQQVAQKNVPGQSTPFLYKTLGTVLILFGLVASATGYYWQKQITGFLTGPAWAEEIELWLPFWPFEPFIPLMIVGLGTLLITQVRSEATTPTRS
tara:strand:+ start:15616 stop:16545 length:930 start_codon:yes stop_codon:yes gene_type:complete